MGQSRLTAPLRGALYVEPPIESGAEHLGDVQEVIRRVAAQCWPQVVVVNVPPDIGKSVVRLATSILAQLGKDFDLHHSGHAKENWALAEVWLRAHQTTNLVVLGAQMLNVRLWRKLTSLTTSSEHSVLLVNGGSPLSREHRRLLDAPGGLITPIDGEVLSEWTDELLDDPSVRLRRPAAGRAPEPFPAVPADDVPFFIETCHELLSAEHFAAVRDAYIQGFRQADAWLACPRDGLLEEHVAAFLAGLVRDVADIHEQLTRLRGAQAGFWRHGWLLKLSVDALIAAHRTEEGHFDRQRELRLLNGFVAPRVACVALLALRTRLSPARLAVLNADQLNDDCSTLDLGDEQIHFEAEESVLLRAQLLHSERRGHPANGPLFCTHAGRRVAAGQLQQSLRRAAVDTGLPLTQTWSPPADRHHSHWMHRRGLSLQQLAGNVGK